MWKPRQEPARPRPRGTRAAACAGCCRTARG